VNLDPLAANEADDATDLFTALSKIGAVGYDSSVDVDLSTLYEVPGLKDSDGNALTRVPFDVFPGAPSIDDHQNVATKGNYEKLGVPQTGVFYRNVGQVEGTSIENLTSLLPLYVVANSETVIPPPLSGRRTKECHSTTFGSTAPPSLADGRIVFLGLDDEADPQCGGIYWAGVDERKNYPDLRTLVDLETEVPGQEGAKFSTLG
jgi:hypothetical protein